MPAITDLEDRAGREHRVASARDDALVTIAYYQALLDGGVPRDFARALTLAYAQSPTVEVESE